MTTWAELKAQLHRQRMTDSGMVQTQVDLVVKKGQRYISVGNLAMHLRSVAVICAADNIAAEPALNYLAEQLEKLEAHSTETAK